MTRPHVLVIRFGALGDLIMCRQAFHEIREAHRGAEIALLTTPPFENLARSMPWFDSIITAERAPFWQIGEWKELLQKLYNFAPHRVYDLQGKFRQNMLFMLMGGPLWGPEWSGAAAGCSHPRPWPPKPDMHFVGFLGAQLRNAGAPPSTPADMSWLDAPLDGFILPERFALLIPGCSPKLMHKRWPAEHYASLAKQLLQQGINSIAIGMKTEADTITAIRYIAPEVIDLSGQTSLGQIAALARRAVYTIGNDTGPMHLAAAVGSPTLAILSGHTDPVWSRPYGPKTTWVKHDPIAGVTMDEVLLALQVLSP